VAKKGGRKGRRGESSSQSIMKFPYRAFTSSPPEARRKWTKAKQPSDLPSARPSAAPYLVLSVQIRGPNANRY
jgi:hypothetical protein